MKTPPDRRGSSVWSSRGLSAGIRAFPTRCRLTVTDPLPDAEPNPLNAADRTNGADRPGPLRSDIWLTLHTRKAQELVRGRSGAAGRDPIIGLGLFADRLRVIWQAARDDDPYADWWLIMVHDAIADRAALFQRQREDLENTLAQMGAIDIALPESQQPYRIPLRFATPYAYRAANLVASFDTLTRTALATCHVGLLDKTQAGDIIRAGARKLRSLFLIPLGYRFLNIDRATLGGHTDERARRKMGSLPAAVRQGVQRAPLAPLRKVTSVEPARPTPATENLPGGVPQEGPDAIDELDRRDPPGGESSGAP